MQLLETFLAKLLLDDPEIFLRRLFVANFVISFFGVGIGGGVEASQEACES